MSKELKYWRLEDDDQSLSIIGQDFINLMKECDNLKTVKRETEEKYNKKTKGLLLNFLEGLNDFDNVFNNIEKKSENINRQMKIWIGNFKAVRKNLEGILKDTGIFPIEAPEGKAIPGYHTILETREEKGLDDDTILEEIQKGYLWNNEILRKSKVITVKNETEE